MAAGDPAPWSYIATRLATQEIVANSAAITTTEVLVATVTAFLTAGQRYKLLYSGWMSSTVALDQGSFRLREDTIAGTQFVQTNMDLRQAGTTGYACLMIGEYTAVATGNKTFVIGAIRVSGTGTLTVAAGTSRKSYFTLDLIPQ